jgi:hypothetical protein
MSYPQVTVVGSELGGPDDGADLIAAIDRRLTTHPGIIFNYTQPALW